MKKIIIPSEVETLDGSCFHTCKSLEEVIFADDSKLHRIGKEAFAESGLKNITIPREVDIDESAFPSWCEVDGRTELLIEYWARF